MLGKEGLIRRVHLDEAHLHYLEDFRVSYQYMKRFAMLFAPVSTMSGSLPASLVVPLMECLGIHSVSMNALALIRMDAT